MIEDWGIGETVANAFLFSVTALVTGAITTALGQALDTLPGSPGYLAYLVFFIVLPISGFFSDVWEMLFRGLVFTISVAFFSGYLFNDTGEVAAAILALLIALLIAWWNEQGW